MDSSLGVPELYRERLSCVASKRSLEGQPPSMLNSKFLYWVLLSYSLHVPSFLDRSLTPNGISWWATVTPPWWLLTSLPYTTCTICEAPLVTTNLVPSWTLSKNSWGILVKLSVPDTHREKLHCVASGWGLSSHTANRHYPSCVEPFPYRALAWWTLLAPPWWLPDTSTHATLSVSEPCFSQQAAMDLEELWVSCLTPLSWYVWQQVSIHSLVLLTGTQASIVSFQLWIIL